MFIAIDYETYYTGTYSVRTLGNHAYVMDPRFHAGLVAVSTFRDDGCGATFVSDPADVDWQMFAGGLWVAHNADFDRAVHERLIELGKIPAVRPDRWLCTAAAAAFLQIPRDLAGAVKAAFGVELDKSVRANMCGKHWGAGLFKDEEAIRYASSDAIWCGKLWEKIGPSWPEEERRLWELTSEMGRRGVYLDIEKLDAGMASLKIGIDECEKALPFSPAGSIPKFRAACQAAGLSAPKSTAATSIDFDRWLEANMSNDAAAWVRFMQRRRSLGRTLKVLEAMKTRCFDGRMRYDLKYYGGSPGRWSGGGGLNVQNFNRADIEGVDLRHCITASPGKVLAIVDYAQIEARVLLWLAGDHKTLSMLRDGMDIYEAHARSTMGYHDPRPLKEVSNETRRLAKARVLGLGYGCGPDKFITVAKIMGGLTISFDESQEIVKSYRKSNHKICALWYRLEETFKRHDGKTWLLPFPKNRLGKGKRWLIYRDIDAESMSCTVCGDREETYGSKIVENWTQGTARDVMADVWPRCASAGFCPVLSIHDELVFEVAEETCVSDLEKIKAIMSAPVAWAPELPVAVDGHLSKFYCK